MKRILLSVALLMAGMPLLKAQDVKQKQAEKTEAKRRAEKQAAERESENLEMKRTAEKDAMERVMIDRENDNEEIIIRKKTDKDSKVVIEIKDGKVTVNGKSIDDYDDENISIRLRNRPEVFMTMPDSRFRSMDALSGLSGVNLYNTIPDQNNMVFVNSNKAFLGVATEETPEGARITRVTENSAAEKAGLKEDDIITKINETTVTGPNDLTKAIGKLKPEEKITVTYKRENKENKVSAVLGKNNSGFTTAQSFGTTSPRIYMSPGSNGPATVGGFSYNPRSYGGNNRVMGIQLNRPRLGIKAQDLEEGDGVKVLEVTKDSPAEKAGIKAGDIITEFDDAGIENADELAERAMEANGKAVVKVKLTRDGKSQTVEIKTPKKLKTANL